MIDGVFINVDTTQFRCFFFHLFQFLQRDTFDGHYFWFAQDIGQASLFREHQARFRQDFGQDGARLCRHEGFKLPRWGYFNLGQIPCRQMDRSLLRAILWFLLCLKFKDLEDSRHSTCGAVSYLVALLVTCTASSMSMLLFVIFATSTCTTRVCITFEHKCTFQA